MGKSTLDSHDEFHKAIVNKNGKRHELEKGNKTNYFHPDGGEYTVGELLLEEKEGATFLVVREDAPSTNYHYLPLSKVEEFVWLGR